MMYVRRLKETEIKMEEYILIDYVKGKLDPVEASKVEEWVAPRMSIAQRLRTSTC